MNLMKNRNLLKGCFYKVLALMFTICIFNQLYSQAPPNIGFEYNNLTNWKSYISSGSFVIPSSITNNTTPLTGKNTTYGALFTNTYLSAGTGPKLGYVRVTSATQKNDVYGNFPVVCNLNGAGKHSVKLGNDSLSSVCQGISYNIHIPAGRNKYKVVFYYAIVLDDPGTHECWEMPFFNVVGFDSANQNSVIPCSQLDVDICSVKNDATLFGNWHKSKTLANGFDTAYYTAWTPATIIAKNMGGKTLTLRFLSSGCSPAFGVGTGSPGSHFGYAYVDFDTTASAINGDTLRYCPKDTCFTYAPPPGYKGYIIYDSASKQQLGIDTNHAVSSIPKITMCGKNMPKVKSTMEVILTPYSGFGCVDTLYYYIDTFPTHILPPIVSPKDSLCAGTSMTLTDATAGGVWVSDSTKFGTITNTGVFSGLTSGADMIEYHAKNKWGCPDTIKKTIVVAGLIIGPIIGKNGVCIGDTIHLSDSTTGGTWVSSNPAIATIDPNTGIVSGLSYGTVSISYTFANTVGCAGTGTKTLQVGIPPLTPITGYNTICINHPDTLSNTTAGGSWISTDSTVATIGSGTGIVIGIKPGTTTIKYIYAFGGCSDSVLYPLTVNAAVAPPIVSDSVVCQRHSITLSNASFGGTWISLNSSVATINAQGVLSGLIPGIDSIKYVINNNGCSDSAYKAITVNPTPTTSLILGATNICYGKTSLYTDTTLNGVWSSSNNNVASINASSGLATANGSGNATIKYIVTNIYGCSDSSSLPIIVNPKPTIGQINGSDSLCIRVISQFADATNSGVWTTTNPTIASIDSVTGIFVTHQLGNDTVRYTVTTGMGCVDSVYKAFVVNPTPKASPIFATNQYFCVGDTIHLSDTTASGVWASANPTVISVNSAGVAAALSSGYAPISYTITNQYGCSDTAYINLFANALPPLTPITGNFNICIGTTTYMNNFLKGGVWSSGNTSIVTIDKFGAITGIMPGSAYIYYTVTKANCTSKDSIQVFVSGTPVVAAITGPKAVCYNQSIIISTSSVGGVWQAVTPRFVSIDASGNVTGLAPGVGIVKYTLTNANGCFTTLFDTITVNNLPQIAAISGRKDVCVGQQGILNTTPTGGVWSLTNTALATINPVSGAVWGLINGQDTVKYIYTDANACTDSVFATYTVDPLPVIAPITGNTNICINSIATLRDSIPRKGVWVTTDSTILQVTYDGIIRGISAGSASIRYVVISKQGCADSVSTLVKVNALPVINAISGPSVVCVNDSIPLTVTATDPGVWTVMDNTIGSIDSVTGIFKGISAGIDSAIYTATNSIGCSNKAGHLIKVNPLPIIDSVQGNQMPVCTKDSIRLYSNTQGGVWTSISPIYATINYNTGWLTGVNAGVAGVRYIVTSGYGCKDSIDGYATIKGRPVVNWALLKDVCLPDGVATFSSYNTLLPFNPTPVTYLWEFGDTLNTASANTAVTTHRFYPPISATGYNIKLTVTANGCPADTTIWLSPTHIHAQPKAPFITVPAPPEVCIGSTIEFADSSFASGVDSIKSIWYLGDNTIDTALVLDYQYAYPTTYWAYHRIIDKYGCLSDSTGILVTIDTFPTLNTGPINYILVGDSAILSPTISGNIISYNWTPNIPSNYLNNTTIANPVCTPLNNVTYLVSVTGAGGYAGNQGCTISDSLRVIALAPFHMPNAFSPNGDGPHDYFDAIELHQYPDVDVKIFDRTGQVVFSSTGTYKPWNGRFNNTGQLVPVGIYYYIIKRGYNLPLLSGGVTIFR